MDNLILTRQLFDPTSVHTIDLQLVLGSIKKLKNRLLRVDDVWEALMTQFQCFHQLIQNWAKSSTTAVMPRLTGLDGMEAATLQWRRAEFAAAGYRTADPAWSPIQGIDGTSASAAAALGDVGSGSTRAASRFPGAYRLQTTLQPLDEWHDLPLRSRVHQVLLHV